MTFYDDRVGVTPGCTILLRYLFFALPQCKGSGIFLDVLENSWTIVTAHLSWFIGVTRYSHAPTVVALRLRMNFRIFVDETRFLSTEHEMYEEAPNYRTVLHSTCKVSTPSASLRIRHLYLVFRFASRNKTGRRIPPSADPLWGLVF